MKPRSDDYRYTVHVTGEGLTPLVLVKAFMGPVEIQVLNISQGGVALIAPEGFSTEIGHLHDISLSLHERDFPARVEIKAIRGRRLHCMFVNPSRHFQSYLRGFLQPKYLGAQLRRSESLTDRPDALALVPEAEHHYAYTGENQLGFFVWTKGHRQLLKIVGLSRDLVFEWTASDGIQTGRLKLEVGADDVVWDRNPEMTVLHYFTDILLAWLPKGDGAAFAERLMNDPIGGEGEEPLSFPEL